MLSKQLIDSVKLGEGWRSKTYLDSVGVPTIGYGTNLLELEISEETGEKWMREALEKVRDRLSDDPVYRGIASRVRRDVLIEMGYNLGVAGLYKFRKMWAALEAGDFDEAADEALDSKWADQVGYRAKRLARRLRTGVY